MPTTSALAEHVDLQRYPIHDLESPAGRALVLRARAELAALGACDLPGFFRPAAVAGTLAHVDRDATFRMEDTHDIEFTGVDPATRAEDDPLRTQVRSAKGCVAYDEIPADSPLRAVYESDELTRFVAAAVEAEPLYRQADEVGALNVMIYEPGDELGWHFDRADFVVTLMLQPPTAGGAFEYVPMLRSEDDRNDEGVRALLDGDRTGIRSMSGEAGTLALFRGHLSPHRVTPVEGDVPRINATLAFADRPDARLDASALALFYGR